MNFDQLERINTESSQITLAGNFKINTDLDNQRQIIHFLIESAVTDFNKSVFIKHLPNGKPYLTNSHQDLSISHKENAYMIGLSKNFKIGVDVENLQRPMSSDFLQNYVLSDHEKKSGLHTVLKNKLSINESEVGYYLWSIKEAFFKSLNTTDFHPRNYIVNFDNDNLQVLTSDGVLKSKNVQLFRRGHLIYVEVLS